MEAKRVIVTAALPYANGELHLGHLKSTYLPADIYVRYLRLKGVDVVYVCGSDQHGTPIDIAARERGIEAREYADYWWKVHKEDFDKMRISFDVFYKTHSPENIELTQYFLRKARENGYLYKKRVKQLYCPRDRIFLADRYVKGTCPYCGAEDQYGDHCEVCGATYEVWELKNPRCSICGGEPEIRESEHLFFKLSAFTGKLKEYINSNRYFQREVVNYLNMWLEKGLRDWDITREENYWGIDLPFEDLKGKKAYVWFDAPIGYISFTVKWAKEKGVNWEDYWKSPDSAIVHFIGKDIVYHHFLFWPAMLMSVGEFNLPTKIVVRGFLTLEGRKFSKSRKWYISIREAASLFDPDYIRFYLTLISPASLEDTDFKLRDFMNLVNSGLSDTIGNYVHRTLTLVYKFFDAVVPEPGTWTEYDENMAAKIRAIPGELGKIIEQFDFKRALEYILDFTRAFNKYLNDRQPWKLAKAAPEEAKTVLYVCSNAVKCLAISLYPFIPGIAEKIWSMLYSGRCLEEVRWEDAGKLDLANAKISRPVIVAPRIEERQLEEAKKLLQRAKAHE